LFSSACVLVATCRDAVFSDHSCLARPCTAAPQTCFQLGKLITARHQISARLRKPRCVLSTVRNPLITVNHHSFSTHPSSSLIPMASSTSKSSASLSHEQGSGVSVFGFGDGDTEVIFPWGTYRLHSQVLSCASEYLRAVFNWPRNDYSYESGSSQNAIRWRLVRAEDELLTVASDEHPVPERTVSC
jgi:hypothetical protein